MLHRREFQSLVNGKATGVYFMESKNIKAMLTIYGAKMVSILVPDDGRRVFCLEIQNFSNSLTEPMMPATIKVVGKVCTSTVIHKFYLAS